MELFIILGVFMWFMVALWPAFLAQKKGYSFLLFLLLAWVTSWLFTLLVVLIIPNKTPPRNPIKLAS